MKTSWIVRSLTARFALDKGIEGRTKKHQWQLRLSSMSTRSHRSRQFSVRVTLSVTQMILLVVPDHSFGDALAAFLLKVSSSTGMPASNHLLGGLTDGQCTRSRPKEDQPSTIMICD